MIMAKRFHYEETSSTNTSHLPNQLVDHFKKYSISPPTTTLAKKKADTIQHSPWQRHTTITTTTKKKGNRSSSEKETMESNKQIIILPLVFRAHTTSHATQRKHGNHPKDMQQTNNPKSRFKYKNYKLWQEHITTRQSSQRAVQQSRLNFVKKRKLWHKKITYKQKRDTNGERENKKKKRINFSGKSPRMRSMIWWAPEIDARTTEMVERFGGLTEEAGVGGDRRIMAAPAREGAEEEGDDDRSGRSCHARMKWNDIKMKERGRE